MPGMSRPADYITTNEAAGALGVTRQRVLQLIQDGRLKAEKFGNVYMIRRGDLAHIEEKPMGRPPKAGKVAPSPDGRVIVKKPAKRRGRKAT